MIPRSGREVSRVEGFSDAVFGFALTLLVVSLEVPMSFDGLKVILTGFVPFGLTFALVCWIWYEHYAFFRRFDAEDPLTIALNCALLFLVLFFVYPLKFVFGNVVQAMMGEPFAFRDMTEGDNRLLLWVYSAGFAGMMGLFALLYWNVYRKRHRLQLSSEDVFDAKAGVRTHFISVGVALVSIMLALTVPLQWIWTAGAIYSLQGPLHFANGASIARARARAFPSSTPKLP